MSKNTEMRTIFFRHILAVSVAMAISCGSNDEDIDKRPEYPAFGPERDVIINGLSFDAMEPFISPDGKYLLFNNLNDGINTKLYYATKINDSIFEYAGEIIGVNQTETPHLDAVPDLDSSGHFYWTSTRNYPAELNNLYYGTFRDGVVQNIGRVQGDFNKNLPGWLVMDHGISLDGKLLYYNNARFDNSNCQGPCETTLGIAQKVNDSTFNTLENSASILQNVTDENYIYYAPCISSDDLELYFTRFLKREVNPQTVFEICVAVREDSQLQFSVPQVLFSDNAVNLIEAPTLTSNQNIIYYHRKTADSHKIVMRYRKPG